MVEIRRLRPGDGQIARRAMERFEPPRHGVRGGVHLADTLADPRTVVVVALDEGEAIGHARAHELPRFDGPRPKMLLYKIDVAESHRRRGIARALTAELLRVSRERDCLNLWVITDERNTEAMHLYPATGAVRPMTDEVVFAWDLDAPAVAETA